MLVLTRKKNDSIVIDGRILVEVLQIKGSGIRLGISAPPDVSILRGELKPFGLDRDGDASSHLDQRHTLNLYQDAPQSDLPKSSQEGSSDSSLRKPLGLHGRLTNRKRRW